MRPMKTTSRAADKATDKAAKRQDSKESEARQVEAFQLRTDEEPPQERASELASQVHLLKSDIVCDTEARGHATPQGRSPLEIVLESSGGFIPLWAENTTLRWRFRERSMDNFTNPAAAKRAIRRLLAESVLAWGSAAPVRFTEDEDVWDFEIVMRGSDNCNASGACVLASAFFPDPGRHQLLLYPRMFTQTRDEQVETFIHEIGHIFGLRHFFANISENEWPSEIFGTHSKFSIMNYGHLSALTDEDRNDLRQLYRLARSGALTHINGTPIQLVKPFSTLGQIQTVLQTQSRGTFSSNGT